MYGRSERPRGGGDSLRDFFLKGGIPATLIIIALNVATWLCSISGVGIGRFLAFTSETWPSPTFWSVITWPLLGEGHPINLLFACLWAWWVCGSLERSWGTRIFLMFFAATSVLTAVTTFLGGLLLHRDVILYGLSMAIAAPTVAWCIINRRESVYFYFIPVPALAIGALSVVILWYEVGPPLLGLFALSGCAAAWWYAAQGRNATLSYSTRRNADFGFNIGNRQGRGSDVTPETASRFYQFDRETVGPPRRGFNLVRWWRDRQERKRLEEIFRRSGYTDKEDK